MKNLTRLGRISGRFLPLVLGAALMAPATAAAQIEVMPLIGVGELTDAAGESYDAGLVVGLSVGARLSTLVSIQAQGEYDRLNIDNSIRVDEEGHVARLALSPAFHLVRDKIDLSLGPTFGVWRFSTNFQVANQEGSFTMRGTELGVRASMLFGASPLVSVGPTFGYVRMWTSKTCLKAIGSETCNTDPDRDDDGFWSLAFAARF
ncbi:MAG TPA: hypothetical protein VGF45_18625 [Polyangia bacterium]